MYLSLRELLSKTESVEIWGHKSHLDLVDSSMEALHLCLQVQQVLCRDTEEKTVKVSRCKQEYTENSLVCLASTSALSWANVHIADMARV